MTALAGFAGLTRHRAGAEGFRDEKQHEEGDGKIISSRESCGIPPRGRTGPGSHLPAKVMPVRESVGVKVTVLAVVLC
jgi:hypothetical protein